jgi:hypothetical protein
MKGLWLSEAEMQGVKIGGNGSGGTAGAGETNFREIGARRDVGASIRTSMVPNNYNYTPLLKFTTE